jgi:hypothetical protein
MEKYCILVDIVALMLWIVLNCMMHYQQINYKHVVFLYTVSSLRCISMVRYATRIFLEEQIVIEKSTFQLAKTNSPIAPPDCQFY